ncbi:MAG TPA: hypothetical protein VMO00_07105 [Methylomirabilota bacterium]|nr:hypothetical protein [Methylomirabilota bacterium]
MIKKLHPSWSKQDESKGKRMHQVWDQFFSEKEATEKGPGLPLSGQSKDHRLSTVLSQQEAALMSFPNVLGVAEGIRTKGGKPTGERCLVVYVSRKILKSKLREKEILPREVDGVPIDVVEVGRVEPLPL